MNSSRESSVSVTPSQPSYLPPPLSYYAYVPPYMMPTMSSIPSSHSIVQKKIPSLREFLSELDEIYGEGTYTRFEPSFAEQDVSVPYISELTDTEFERLGVDKIGWRKVLRRTALKYV
jgi:hypothetical protein